MCLMNFMRFMDELAEELIVANKTHEDFINKAGVISRAIQRQLVKNNAVFQNLLGKLHTTAVYVNNLFMDIPLNFDIFLPIRIPVPVKLRFEKTERTVQVTRFRTQHPFFFGNGLNFKLMNIMLSQELGKVVKKLRTVNAFGVIYDLSYTVFRRGGIPFLHQLVATECGSYGERCIRFDFVLALGFEGGNTPLPSYYDAPIAGQWLAYGLAGEERSPDDWFVLVPKWKTADPGVCLRSSSSLIMLYRLMKVQKCQLYALPYSLKLSFVLVTEERGEMYQNMSVGEMTLTILFHEVSRDLYQAALEHTRRDRLSRSSKLLSIRKQQIRARGIYYILTDSALKDLIHSEFVFAFFSHLYIPPVPSSSKWILIKEVDTKVVPDFPLEMEYGIPLPKPKTSNCSNSLR
ncbi:uncharacterized protein LOC110183672 [Drosophila serrata]|uniref:uncharacterized protein LOC110183672 n=1 Tax=Drosophila serrata TaxID=7274 RepID=UPI000A1D151D|nr:uncharacterized protein LOC110183672 [Drosophila serrata]